MNTSTTPRRTGKNIEENKARAEALHNSISEQVELLRTSERWHAFLDFAQSFHDYSLHNLLLLSQNPDATRVAGFRKWQTLGRQVRKGEIGIRIFGYSTKKTTEEDENGDTNLINPPPHVCSRPRAMSLPSFSQTGRGVRPDNWHKRELLRSE